MSNIIKEVISDKNYEMTGFSRCKFGGEFTECNMSGTKFIKDNIDGGWVIESSATGMGLDRVNFSGSCFSSCDFSNVEISSCKLDGMTLNGISALELLEFYKKNHKESNDMNREARIPVMAGNWKMNKTRPEAVKLVKDLAEAVEGDVKCEVIACVPFTDIESAQNAANGSFIKIGAQNCHFEKSGAFTGEISADMLKELGVEYVVLGHSERRQYFGETDETVNKRTRAALSAGLRPIVCVGELLWERECNITEEVIARQIKLDFFNVGAAELQNCIIAYEPVWAIGTGKTATEAQAQEVCAFIRSVIAKIYDQSAADSIRILYGGSMNEKNVQALLAEPDVDGGLVGGASLKPQAFADMIKAASV